MNQTLHKLYNIQLRFQTSLFPHIKQELVFLTKFQQKLIEVLEISQIDSFIPYIGKRACRPTKLRMALARCFLAKAVYNMVTTELLIEQLTSDLSLRRLCGYEKIEQLPSQPTRLEKQALGMTIHDMLLDLPTHCNIGTKMNSKGYKSSWQGY